MTKQQAKAAAEVMRRWAEGEVVEVRSTPDGPYDGDRAWVGLGKLEPAFDFTESEYRILDFPEPPKGKKWRNKNSVNATQVGVNEGWRLLLEGEEDAPIAVDAEYFDSLDGDQWKPLHSGWLELDRTMRKGDRIHTTVRTKAPLPKEDPMEEAMALSIRNGAFPGTGRDIFVFAWKACLKHYNITP